MQDDDLISSVLGRGWKTTPAPFRQVPSRRIHESEDEDEDEDEAEHSEIENNKFLTQEDLESFGIGNGDNVSHPVDDDDDDDSGDEGHDGFAKGGKLSSSMAIVTPQKVSFKRETPAEVKSAFKAASSLSSNDPEVAFEVGDKKKDSRARTPGVPESGDGNDVVETIRSIRSSRQQLTEVENKSPSGSHQPPPSKEASSDISEIASIRRRARANLHEDTVSRPKRQSPRNPEELKEISESKAALNAKLGGGGGREDGGLYVGGMKIM